MKSPPTEFRNGSVNGVNSGDVESPDNPNLPRALAVTNSAKASNSLPRLKNKPGSIGMEADLRKDDRVNKDSGVDANNNAKETARSSLLPLEITVPLQIGKYLIGSRLGSGTCGVVHQALDNVLNREVAIKLSPSGDAQASTGKVPGAQRAYQTEVFAAGRLRHPNIVTVYDAGQYEELNYIVMESVDGNSLKHFGKGQKLLPTFRALDVICECCKALDYSHNQDILHRDIKPANVMVALEGSVKLLDFGIAVGLSEDSGLNRSGPTLGTPNYMSPEQILGKTLTPASDFYSLGTVMFELLTGKQLFKAKKVKDLFRTVVHQSAPKLQEFRPDLPAALSELVDRSLQKKPERRFQTGKEMIAALAPFVEHFKIIEERSYEQIALIPVLQNLPFFQAFSDADIARLLAEAKMDKIEKGVKLLSGGNQNRELLVIIDGIVSMESKDGIHRIYGPGECVGELGFIHGTLETTQPQARSALRVLRVTSDTLAAMPPKLHLHYYKRISDILVTRMARQQVDFEPDLELTS